MREERTTHKMNAYLMEAHPGHWAVALHDAAGDVADDDGMDAPKASPPATDEATAACAANWRSECMAASTSTTKARAAAK